MLNTKNEARTWRTSEEHEKYEEHEEHEELEIRFLFTNTCEIILERRRTKNTKKTTKKTRDY
jgi:hypothetical protein